MSKPKPLSNEEVLRKAIKTAVDNLKPYGSESYCRAWRVREELIRVLNATNPGIGECLCDSFVLIGHCPTHGYVGAY